METGKAWMKYGKERIFLNFLRGMETSGFYPETRGDVPFLNFLRGMETLPVFMNAIQTISFLNFLRGMETVFRGFRFLIFNSLPKLP